MPHNSVYTGVTFEKWEKGAHCRGYTFYVGSPWPWHQRSLVVTGRIRAQRVLDGWVNPGIQGSLRKTTYAKLLKDLAPAFMPCLCLQFCLYLQFTGCLTTKKFSQQFLWAGGGSPSFWWNDFFRRRKLVLNLIEFLPVTLLHNTGLTGRVHYLPPSPAPSPGHGRVQMPCVPVYMCTCTYKCSLKVGLLWNARRHLNFA